MHNNIQGALLYVLPRTTHFPYQDRTTCFMEILYGFFYNSPADLELLFCLDEKNKESEIMSTAKNLTLKSVAKRF
jgi:hypothetical protein